MKNYSLVFLAGLTLAGATAQPGSAQEAPGPPSQASTAAQASTAGGWVLSKGDNPAEMTAQGIHITQAVPKDTTAYTTATAPLALRDASAWRVSFDVRFGQLRSAGASVRLTQVGVVIGSVGADGWYKGMGAFIGPDSRFGRPADALWHRFVYECDGKTLAVWHDGVKVAEGNALGAPDRIAVGSWWDGKGPAGQQTEVWLKDVQAAQIEDVAVRMGDGAIRTPKAVTGPSPEPLPVRAARITPRAAASSDVSDRDDSTATLAETMQWMIHQINTTPTYLDRDGAPEEIYSDAAYAASDLSYTVEYRPTPFEDNLNRVTVSLDLLDQASVAYAAEAAEGDASATYLITYRPSAGMNAVKNHRFSGSTLIQGGFLQLPSEDAARRFVKALRHAIRLCQSKAGQPF